MAVKIRAALRNLLLADSALVALVGDRIYSQQVPNNQPALPTIMFKREAGQVHQNITGALCGITSAVYSFYIFGRNQEECENVRARIYAVLPGANRDVTVGSETVQIRGIDTEDTAETFEETDDPDIDALHLQFNVWYREFTS